MVLLKRFWSAGLSSPMPAGYVNIAPAALGTLGMISTCKNCWRNGEPAGGATVIISKFQCALDLRIEKYLFELRRFAYRTSAE
jgi:hypothetical protein